MITLTSKVKSQIKKINKILKDRYPSFTLALEPLENLNVITGDTKLMFLEKTAVNVAPKMYIKKYEHFMYRGVLGSSDIQPTALYLVMMRNKMTNRIHYKYGITNSHVVKERFYKQSNTWEFVAEAVPARIGPRSQILQIEKNLKAFAQRHNMTAQNVQDFIYGGKTELLVATTEMPLDKWIEFQRIFNDKGFDDLA